MHEFYCHNATIFVNNYTNVNLNIYLKFLKYIYNCHRLPTTEASSVLFYGRTNRQKPCTRVSVLVRISLNCFISFVNAFTKAPFFDYLGHSFVSFGTRTICQQKHGFKKNYGEHSHIFSHAQQSVLYLRCRKCKIDTRS